MRVCALFLSSLSLVFVMMIVVFVSVVSLGFVIQTFVPFLRSTAQKGYNYYFS
jgi:hypothetical protein